MSNLPLRDEAENEGGSDEKIPKGLTKETKRDLKSKSEVEGLEEENF